MKNYKKLNMKTYIIKNNLKSINLIMSYPNPVELCFNLNPEIPVEESSTNDWLSFSNEEAKNAAKLVWIPDQGLKLYGTKDQKESYQPFLASFHSASLQRIRTGYQPQPGPYTYLSIMGKNHNGEITSIGLSLGHPDYADFYFVLIQEFIVSLVDKIQFEKDELDFKIMDM